MQDETMEKDAISLKAVFSLLAKRWWIILLAGVLCAAILIVCTALFCGHQISGERDDVYQYINRADVHQAERLKHRPRFGGYLLLDSFVT